MEMETSLSSSWFIGARLQASHDSYINMPSSLLVEEESMDSSFTPSSPSLDMEAALQHLGRSSCDSELSSSPISSEDTEVLMVDPYLDFLNEVLMEEEEVEDSQWLVMQGDAEAHYQATLSSLYDIIGEHSSPPGSTTLEIASAAHVSQEYAASHEPARDEIFSGLDLSNSWGRGNQFEPYSGLSNSSSEIRSTGSFNSTFPDIAAPHTSMQEWEAESESLRSRQGSPILEQTNGETRAVPPTSDSSLGLKQGNAKCYLFPTSSTSHVSSGKGEPEMPSLQHESVEELLSQVDDAGRYRNSGRFNAHKDDVVRRLNDSGHGNGTQSQDQIEGMDDCRHSSLKVESKQKIVTLADVKIEDLRDEAAYTALYVGAPIAYTTAQGSSVSREKKATNGGRKGHKPGRKGKTEVLGFVDLREVLVSCAQAVAVGDGKKANEILQELYLVHGVSSHGNSLQRSTHYFCEALMARMGGMGGQHYRDMCANAPSARKFLKIMKAWFQCSPYVRIMHYFANQNILKAAEGALRLHIVDYGMMYGIQWPCLINALADREGGPPLLVLTGIDFPKLGQNGLDWLEESGQRLAAYAKSCNVPFQFHAIATDKWEDVDAASLHLHAEEVLVVNCMKRLRHLSDESTDLLDSTISPRQKLLMSMRSLKPHLLLLADAIVASSSPFFISRFREALYLYTNMFDALANLWDDRPERVFIEKYMYARDILNIVACEGADRVERFETQRQWDTRIKRAGFEQLPIPSFILSRSKSHVKQHYHPDFMVHDDKGWMLLGWKGRSILAMCAWVPCHVL